MAGQFVPVVLIPRFTSYIGDSVCRSVALDVTEFQRCILTVWWGPLVGDTSNGAKFELTLEVSDDNDQWVEPSGFTALTVPPENAAGGNSTFDVTLTRRFLRIVASMTEDTTDGVVAVTCWAAGHLERREP